MGKNNNIVDAEKEQRTAHTRLLSPEQPSMAHATVHVDLRSAHSRKTTQNNKHGCLSLSLWVFHSVQANLQTVYYRVQPVRRHEGMAHELV